MNLPPYPRFPVLVSDVVVLRPVLPADAESLFEISFYDAHPAQNPVEAAEMQAKIAADYQLGTAIHWAIELVATAEVVGTLGYYRGFESGIGELGCVLKPAFRGQGLMRAAMQLALDFGFHEVKLAQIVATTTRPNQAAIRLLERLGFAKTANLPGAAVAYALRQAAG